MGGNALACIVVRLEKEEFLKVSEIGLNRLRETYKDNKFMLPLQLPTKESFGDLDVIYSGSEVDLKLSSFGNFRPEFSFYNGNIISFDYKLDGWDKFQIDLINVPEESLEFAKMYHSYGDTFNMVGRVYKQAGFKFSHEGLKYHYSSNFNHKDLFLTRDFDIALEFMGYPRWREHTFDDLESVFKYVFSTPYSNNAMYMIENSNHVDRLRNKKRPMFMKLQDYLKEHPNMTANYDWSDKDKHRKQWLEKAFDLFPDFKKQYEMCVQLDNIEKEYRSKFNGRIVTEVTGITGVLLGDFINDLKHYYSEKHDFKNLILSSDEYEIKQLIQSFYENG